MWGWKTADRTIEPSVSFDEAKQIVQQAGFELVVSNPSHAVLKRAGTESGWTQFAPEGENLPLELAIAQSERGLFVQLRYEHFVLFDTGDLDRVADEVAAAFRRAE
ncbi:hypothetical protein NG895_06675 [Aeoliella sp. ICT_H6.2]|uniref:Uncharacterized protein n=1 Tax=Aeoliella straminimaris TaxID=2954799 RepID=A0A9X2JFD6_9BACT|nr:hypothetical protein [Aeoliella straminimaris]MCO6043586.1 hypothetical protein [Aeoliella straminimaris]